jgi:hypothetical protein
MRALANAKLRARERASQVFHVQRVMAELQLSAAPVQLQSTAQCRLVLNDLTPTHVVIFSNAPMPVGQMAGLSFLHPQPSYIKGRIVNCQEYDVDSHVLSQDAYSYRIGFRFVFATPEEEAMVRNLCEDLKRSHLYGRRAA